MGLQDCRWLESSGLALRNSRIGVPLNLALALLLIGAVLGTAALLSLHYYTQTSRPVLKAAHNVFTAMGQESCKSGRVRLHPFRRLSTSLR